MFTTFEFFQLIILIAFLAVFIGRSIFLYTRHEINPFVLGVGKTGFHRFIELSFLVGFSCWVVEILIQVFHWEWHIFGGFFVLQIIDLVPVKVLGMILIVLGFLFFVSALFAFGKSWRVGIDEATPGDLVTQGVFGWSRNPIFLFIDLYFVGTFLINGTWFFLLIAVAVVSGMHYQILQEEKFLLKNYGQSYRAYLNRVGRYLSLYRRKS